LNTNDRLDMNLSGRALEPWGASNNPRPETVRPPTWREARFTLGAEGTHLVIELHQP